MDNIEGKFDKLFHDYGMWIMFVLVALVIAVLFTIWSFATQRSKGMEAPEDGTALQR